jgi:hypothetical protein
MKGGNGGTIRAYPAQSEAVLELYISTIRVTANEFYNFQFSRVKPRVLVHWYQFTKPYGVTSEKDVILIVYCLGRFKVMPILFSYTSEHTVMPTA